MSPYDKLKLFWKAARRSEPLFFFFFYWPRSRVDRFAWARARAREIVQICKYTQFGARAKARVVLKAPLELNVI